jgi:hypothetical protein
MNMSFCPSQRCRCRRSDRQDSHVGQLILAVTQPIQLAGGLDGPSGEVTAGQMT